MKQNISKTIALLAAMLISGSMWAQTITKSVEAISEAKELKIVVGENKITDNGGARGTDTEGPKMILSKPDEAERIALTLDIGSSKGAALTTGIKFSGVIDDASGVKQLVLQSDAINSKELTIVKGQFDERIAFPVGKHTVKLIATDMLGNATIKTVNFEVVKEVVPELRRPNLYVLSIGISKFQYSISKELIKAGESGFTNLEYAHADAQALAEEFKKQEGVLYNRVQTKVIINEQATRKGILDGLNWLLSNISEGDVAIITISSHAFQLYGESYLMTYNAQLSSLEADAYAFHEITKKVETLNKRKCKTVMFIDACHSGNLLAEGSKGATNINIEDAVNDLNSNEKGVLMLLSSTGSQNSWEHADWKHGAFTYAMLEAMQQGKGDIDKDYILSYDELQLYVKERVKNLTGGKQHPMQGNFKTGIARFPVCVIKDKP